MSCLRIERYDIVMEEIPTELSLSFSCTGCPIRCPNCHWKELQDPNRGHKLTIDEYIQILDKYKDFVTCILFFGGEWNKDCLKDFLIIARSYGFKTALYTGLSDINDDIKQYLNYLKIGPYIENLGPLNSIKTNQKLINLDTGEILNKYFYSKYAMQGETQ